MGEGERSVDPGEVAARHPIGERAQRRSGRDLSDSGDRSSKDSDGPSLIRGRDERARAHSPNTQRPMAAGQDPSFARVTRQRPEQTSDVRRGPAANHPDQTAHARPQG